MIEYDSVFGSVFCSVHLPFRASFFAPAITSFPYFDVRIMFCDNYCRCRRRSLLLSTIEINRLTRCLADEIINAAKGSSNSYAIKKKVNDFCCIAFISCLQSLISFSYRTSLSVSPRATANPLCFCIVLCVKVSIGIARVLKLIFLFYVTRITPIEQTSSHSPPSSNDNLQRLCTRPPACHARPRGWASCRAPKAPSSRDGGGRRRLAVIAIVETQKQQKVAAAMQSE